MSSNLYTDKSGIKTSVESALRAALMVIERGGSTAMADNTFKNIISKCDVSDVSVMWRLDNVILGYTIDGQTTTVLRPVGGIGTDLTGVSKVIELSEDVAEGKTDISDVNSELEKISKLPPVHTNWTLILVAALAAAFYSKFHYGAIGSIAVVFIAALIGQTLRLKLKSKKVKDGQITLICGLLSAGITSMALQLGFGKLDMPIMIASVIYMVPGLLMINGFVDLTKQRFIFIGMQRLLNATFLFIILAVVILTTYTFIKF